MTTPTHRLPVVLVIASSMLAAILTVTVSATADPPPPVDVVIREPPPPRRILTIEYNPLALIVGKVSANIIVVPTDHHALVLSPFYTWTATVPICVATDSGSNSPACGISGPSAVLPRQTFQGLGGELGYRYYLGLGGARGFFAGPSLILASMTATAQDSSRTSFLDYGFALDIGYEALILDRVALALGGGAQYVTTSKSIPDQQLPAAVYANSGVRPRVLVSLGYAF